VRGCEGSAIARSVGNVKGCGGRVIAQSVEERERMWRECNCTVLRVDSVVEHNEEN
jgi:hypothetical protein